LRLQLDSRIAGQRPGPEVGAHQVQQHVAHENVAGPSLERQRQMRQHDRCRHEARVHACRLRRLGVLAQRAQVLLQRAQHVEPAPELRAREAVADREFERVEVARHGLAVRALGVGGREVLGTRCKAQQRIAQQRRGFVTRAVVIHGGMS